MRPVGSKYLLEETLGRGATGTVWRARVREDVVVPGIEPGRPVAIKVLREELAADPDVVMRFLRERSVLLRLSHPNIVQVRDLVVEGELLALVMDLVEGPDLYRYLRSNGPFSPIAGALLMAQIADALAVSHADGIVHRDLKPANVLLATTYADGTEQMHPMLTDFGIARLADSPGITRTHEFIGTPAYIAPESADGRPQTSAVDVYGAGIMLYELVSGRPPFQGDGPLAVLQAHLAQEPQRPANMPEPLWTVIERCLRKDPAQRPSATSLGRALRVVAAGVGVHASPAAVDEALAVAALLLPDPQPAAVPGAPPAAVPDTGDATQVLPAGGFDAAAATRMMGGRPAAEDRTQVLPPGGAVPFGAGDRTQMMPPLDPPGRPPAGQPEAPHPWQTQLRAARDRNQQTEIGYFEPEELRAPQVAPRPYQAGQQPPPPGQYGGPPAPPQGYGQDPRRAGGPQGNPQGGYAQRPPVAPPPYQGGPQHPQQYPQAQPQHPEQGRYQAAPPPYGNPGGQYPGQGGYPPPPPAPVPRRAEPAAPQHREPPQRDTAPREPAPRQAPPQREPRRRSRNRMYIPGLGCLKGCLVVLMVLALAAVALWNFTPLPEYWANVQDWVSTASDWISRTWKSVAG
ncbi:serine/threonine-protein kinase [Kitasatospora sp. NPDC050543]|uniref:serine/threonine-protein kinase n=1 Tax=Kitasatospora sp. NPDC050543 TaxID=3364054 RepID=UPI003794B2ED